MFGSIDPVGRMLGSNLKVSNRLPGGQRVVFDPDNLCGNSLVLSCWNVALDLLSAVERDGASVLMFTAVVSWQLVRSIIVDGHCNIKAKRLSNGLTNSIIDGRSRVFTAACFVGRLS